METENLEQTSTQESGEQPSSGGSAPETQAPAESQTQAAEQSAAAVSNEKPTPFHEHPRFKELIEQRNEQKRLNEALQAQLKSIQQEMQNRFKPEPQEDPLISQIKEVNPDFAQRLQSYDQLKSQVEQFRQFQQEMLMEQKRNMAESTLNSLYEKNKVPEELRPFYRERIRNLSYDKPNADIQDIETFFRQAHEGLSGFFNEFKRKERESYLSAKTNDKTPTSQTGGTAPSSVKTTKSMTSEDVKAKILQEIRAAKEKI